VAEELALKQRIDDRGTIAHRKPFGRNQTQLMQCARDELFASSCRPGNKNVGKVPRDLPRQLEYLNHRRTLSHNPVELQILEKLVLKMTDLETAKESDRKFVERFRKARKIKRLAKIIICAELDCLDRRIDRIKARQQNHVDSGVELESFFEKREPVHLRHLEIDKHDPAAAKLNFSERFLWIGGADCGEPRLLEQLD